MSFSEIRELENSGIECMLILLLGKRRITKDSWLNPDYEKYYKVAKLKNKERKIKIGLNF